jgi:hypothetical protein
VLRSLSLSKDGRESARALLADSAVLPAQIWYSLTPSFLEVMSESGCFGTEKYTINISSIVDIQYESKGCGGCCCYSQIEICLPGGENNHIMRVANRKANSIYEALNNCWEAFQANRAAKGVAAASGAD